MFLFDRAGLWFSPPAGQLMLPDQFFDLRRQINVAAPRAADFYPGSRRFDDDAGFMAMNAFHLSKSSRFMV
jgi:hypothetical protein